jgi:uridine phosphorylase
LGSHLVTEYAVGLDSLMHFYPLLQTGYETTISVALQEYLKLGYQPYCVRGSDILREQLGYDMVPGHTVTCPGFYAPQGRHLRLGLKIENLMQQLQRFNVDTENIEGFMLTNFEMETSALYALGRMLEHEVISLNAIVANRINYQFHPESEVVIDALIRKTLDRLAITG